MNHDLSALEPWVQGLLLQLTPTARRKLNQQIAQELRCSQQQRIQAQQTPEGIPYTPRKQRKQFTDKKGRIKRQKAAMFSKLRTNTHLKTKADTNQIEVGFYGRVARIARVHQLGLREKVSQKSQAITYPKRELLGINNEEKKTIRDTLLRHMQIGRQ